MLEKGLVPNLEKARKLASPGSNEELKLRNLRDLTNRMSGEVEKAIAASRIGKSAEVLAVLGALKANREQVEKKVEAVEPR
jgi:hypothetical protein